MPEAVIVNIPGERIPDGMGGWITGPGSTVETRGRLRDLSSSEQVAAERMTERVDAVLVLPKSVEVKSTYSVQVGQVLYSVRGVRGGSYSPHVTVLVSRSG